MQYKLTYESLEQKHLEGFDTPFSQELIEPPLSLQEAFCYAAQMEAEAFLYYCGAWDGGYTVVPSFRNYEKQEAD